MKASIVLPFEVKIMKNGALQKYTLMSLRASPDCLLRSKSAQSLQPQCSLLATESILSAGGNLTEPRAYSEFTFPWSTDDNRTQQHNPPFDLASLNYASFASIFLLLCTYYSHSLLLLKSWIAEEFAIEIFLKTDAPHFLLENNRFQLN